MGRIKRIKTQSTKNIDASKIEVDNYDYPIFCFKHLHKDYNLDNCNPSEKQRFIERIVQMSQFSWMVIQHSDRHGLGCEKIYLNSISSELPSSIKDKEEVKFLLAFRLFHDKRVIVGYRNRFIFHVVYIDKDGMLYKH